MRRMSQARRGPLGLVLGRVAGSALAGSLLVLAVAGCTGSDPAPAPTAAHPGTAATPTTTTPTADPADVAAAAAIAAVKQWSDAFNSSIELRSSAQYRTTFTKECSVCLRDADSTDALYRKGERIVGGHFHVADLAVVWNKPDQIIVQGRLSADPLTVRMGTRVVDRDGGLRPVAFTWTVKPTSGKWLIASVDALK